jgi:hypothetical protein
MIYNKIDDWILLEDIKDMKERKGIEGFDEWVSE